MSIERKVMTGWTVINHMQDGGDDMFAPGCPLGCIYCNQAGMDVGPNGEDQSPIITTTIDSGISLNTRIFKGDTVVKVIDPSKAVSLLEQFPYYTETESIILENFNDPSLDWQRTIRLVRLLLEIGHQGPIIMITKGGISQRRIEEFRKLKEKGARLFFIVTYSGLPKEIEPASGRKRIETIKKLSEAGFPVILSLRPLIKGINLNEENVSSVLKSVEQYVSAITYGGLYVFEFTRKMFAKVGFALEGVYSPEKSREDERKILTKEADEIVQRVIRKSDVAPLFKHTSCAIAYLHGKYYGAWSHDRLAHWDIDSNACRLCPEIQRSQCNKVQKRDVYTARMLAERRLQEIGYNVRVVPMTVENGASKLLVVDGTLHLSELFFPTAAAGIWVENLPPKQRLLEVIERHLGDIPIRNIILDKENNVWVIEVNTSYNKNMEIKIKHQLWRKTRSHAFKIAFSM